MRLSRNVRNGMKKQLDFGGDPVGIELYIRLFLKEKNYGGGSLYSLIAY